MLEPRYFFLLQCGTFITLWKSASEKEESAMQEHFWNIFCTKRNCSWLLKSASLSRIWKREIAEKCFFQQALESLFQSLLKEALFSDEETSALLDAGFGCSTLSI
jgi:hypothetical protein